MRWLRTVLLAQLAASGAALAQSGEVFTWTDDAGVTHFVDDALAVPAGRAATRSAGSLGQVLTRPAVDSVQAPGPRQRGRSSASRPAAASAEVVQPRAQDEASRARWSDVEAQWRARFVDVRSRIAQHEASLRADRRLLEPGVLGPWYNCGGGVVPFGYGGAGPGLSPGFRSCAR